MNIACISEDVQQNISY